MASLTGASGVAGATVNGRQDSMRMIGTPRGLAHAANATTAETVVSPVRAAGAETRCGVTW